MTNTAFIPKNLPEKLEYLLPFYEAVRKIVDEIAGFNAFFEEGWHYQRHLLRAISVVLERAKLNSWQQVGVLMDCLRASDIDVDSILHKWVPVFRELNDSAWDELTISDYKGQHPTLEHITTFLLAGLAQEFALFSYVPIED